MELREYGRILRRYWQLIVLLPLLAGAFTFLTYEEPAVTYGYELQYSVSFLPAAEGSFEEDPVLSAVQASEYVADDMTEVLRGSRFASFMQQYLSEPLPAGALTSATRISKVHRLVTVNLSAPTQEQAAELGNAFKQATEQDLSALLDELWGTGQLRLELVNDSGVYPIGGGLRSRLDIPLRVGLALIAAVALAFALDYLDDSVRSRDEVERLVGPVLGEIPGGN
jgi:capsular polysaccharide biosynthesis protein